MPLPLRRTSTAGWVVVLLGSLALLAVGVVTYAAGPGPDLGAAVSTTTDSMSGAPVADSLPSGAVPVPVTDTQQPAEDRPVPTAPLVPRHDATLAGQSTVTAPAPVLLTIPDLEVSALIEPVGVASDGQLAIPASGQVVGWYQHGPAPGAGEGSVVLAGHVDTRLDGIGVLAGLTDLSLGAEVEVALADGTSTTYLVTGRQTVPKAELPLAEIFTRAGPERLMIITCGGPFEHDTGHYRDNVVVSAVPAGQDGR